MRSIALLLVFACIPCLAQDSLTLDSFHASTASTPETVTTTKIFNDTGQVIWEDNSDPVKGESSECLRSIVRATTEASSVSAQASDASRHPVSAQKIVTEARQVVSST